MTDQPARKNKSWLPIHPGGALYDLARANNRVILTADEFGRTLRKLGLGPVDFAKLVHVTSSAVRHWLSGKPPLPGWVSAVIELIDCKQIA